MEHHVRELPRVPVRAGPARGALSRRAPGGAGWADPGAAEEAEGLHGGDGGGGGEQRGPGADPQRVSWKNIQYPATMKQPFRKLFF